MTRKPNGNGAVRKRFPKYQRLRSTLLSIALVLFGGALVVGLLLPALMPPGSSEPEHNDPQAPPDSDQGFGFGSNPTPFETKPVAPLGVQQRVGDWVVLSAEIVRDTTIDLRGNLRIESTGSLTLVNVTLLFNVSFVGQYGMTISGRLNVTDADRNPATRYDASLLATTVRDRSRRAFISADTASSIAISNSEIRQMGWGAAARGVTIRAASARITGTLFADNHVGLFLSNTTGAEVKGNSFVENELLGLFVYGGKDHQIAGNLVFGKSQARSETGRFRGTWDGWAADGIGTRQASLEASFGRDDSSSVRLHLGGGAQLWLEKAFVVDESSSWLAVRATWWLFTPTPGTQIAWVGGTVGMSAPTALEGIDGKGRGMTGKDMGKWTPYSFYRELSNVPAGATVWVALGIEYAYGTMDFFVDDVAVDLYSNSASGITAASTASAKFDSNVVRYHRFNGLQITASSGIHVIKSEISRNSGANVILTNTVLSRVEDSDLSYPARGGIGLQGTSKSDVLSNLTILWSEDFGILVQGSNHYVGNSTSSFNKGTYEGGYSLGGLYLDGARSVTVFRNNVSRNNYWGLTDSGGIGNLIDSNQLYWNEALGINGEYRNYQTRITRNIIVGHSTGGIRLKMSAFNLVEGNILLDNFGYGITTRWDAYSPDYNRILNNTIRRSTSCIAVDVALGTVIAGNELSECRTGIAVMPYGAMPDWPMFRQDSRNKGGTFYELPTPWTSVDPTFPIPDHVLSWSEELGDSIRSSPIVSQHKLYIQTDSGRVVAFDDITGERMWEHTLGSSTPDSLPVVGPVFFAPTPATDGKYVIAVAGSKVVALLASTGAPLWEVSFPDLFIGSPIIAGNSAFIGGFSGRVYAFDVVSGNLRWSAQLSDAIVSPVMYTDQNSIVARGWNGTVVAFGEATGNPLWQRTVARGSWSSPILVTGSTEAWGTQISYLLFASLRDATGRSQVVALRSSDGVVVWQRNDLTEDFYASPAQIAGRYTLAYSIYLAALSGTVYILNPLTGATSGTFPVGGVTFSSVSTSFTVNFAVSASGQVTRLFGSGRSPGTWTYNVGRETVSSPAIAYNKLYLTTKDGGVFVFKLKDFGLHLTDNYVHRNSAGISFEYSMEDVDFLGDRFEANEVSFRFLEGGAANATNVTFGPAATDVYADTHTQLTLMNSSAILSRMQIVDEGSRIRVGWHVDLLVLGPDGEPLSSPSLTVRSQTGELLFHGIGDVRGVASSIPLEDYTVTRTGLQEAAPYNFSASKPGYSNSSYFQDVDGYSTLTLRLEPNPDLSSIRIEPNTVTITADEAVAFTSTGYDKDDRPIAIEPVWSSENGTITSNGMFVPWASGTWEVAARIGNLTSRAYVTVLPGQLSRVLVSPNELVLDLGNESVLTVLAYDSKGTVLVNVGVTFAVNPPDLGTLDATGRFTPLRSGTGVIFVSVSSGSISRTNKVNVTVSTVDGTPNIPPDQPEDGGPPATADFLVVISLLIPLVVITSLVLVFSVRALLRHDKQNLPDDHAEPEDEKPPGEAYVCGNCNLEVGADDWKCLHCGAIFG